MKMNQLTLIYENRNRKEKLRNSFCVRPTVRSLESKVYNVKVCHAIL